MIQNKAAVICFRLIVGGMLIWAGVLKILNPLDFAQDIANYRIFPEILSFFFALALPWIELICGALLILGLFPLPSSFLSTEIFAAFACLVLLTLLRGIDVDCGCFGSFSRTLDWKLLLMDIMLFLLSLNIFMVYKRRAGKAGQENY